jgi:uroporphyrinogen-III synthase
MRKVTILSTIELNKTQCELFSKNNIELLQYNFITNSPLKFKLPKHKGSWIFTSKNAVHSVYSSKEKEKCNTKPHYCVGEKTKLELIKNGQKVIKNSKNSLELANFLLKNSKNEKYIFCRGSIVNKDFSDFFNTNGMCLNEIPVYETKLTPKKINSTLDGIMFFSPSAVKSFIKKNDLKKSECFCIGNTTSNFAENFSNSIHFCDEPSIENVINKTINFFKNVHN